MFARGNHMGEFASSSFAFQVALIADSPWLIRARKDSTRQAGSKADGTQKSPHKRWSFAHPLKKKCHFSLIFSGFGLALR
jgi:hypothetical protein